VYYADGKPKQSIGDVRAAARDVVEGDIATCSGLKLSVTASVRPLSRVNGALSANVLCNFTCDFRLRLEKLPAGSATAVVAGTAQGKTPTAVQVPRRVRSGLYRFTLIAWAHANRGSNVSVTSPAFTVR
jgi:hypothetical protein